MISNELAKTMFWMACRYAIGRHSYVSAYANDMGKAMYDIMNADERRHAAVDIRQEIADRLRMMPFSFALDYSIEREKRRPYEMFCDFMNAHPNIDLSQTTRIECSMDYKTKELVYTISTADQPRWKFDTNEYLVEDLRTWADLASLMDEDNHVEVEFMGCDGVLHKEVCYPSYTNETKDEKEDDGMMYCTAIPWRYKVIYRPVKHGVSHRLIDPDAITKISRVK